MVQEIITAQNAFFSTQKTKDVAFRKEYLKRLKLEITTKADALCDALYAHIRKPNFE